MSFLDFLSNTGIAPHELSMLGTSLQVGGIVGQGFAAKGAAKYQAEQLRAGALQAQASAGREAWMIERESQMIASRALAVAAASGGGASDPTVVNLIAQDAAEGAYRKAVALYGGDDKARVMRMEAAGKDYEGKSAVRGSLVSGAANMLQGMEKASSLYQRFGGGGPKVESKDKTGWYD